jgi:hypothetical protein
MEGCSPFDITLPTLPDAVLQALTEREERQQNRGAYHRCPCATEGTNEGVRVNYIPGVSTSTQRFLSGEFAFAEGWNTRLFNAACDLAGNRVDRQLATELLLAGAKPINDRETAKALATIESAYALERVPARAYHRKQTSSRGKRSIRQVGVRTIIRIDP